MERETYIKLSKIRDYGFGRNPEDVIMHLSELEGLNLEQLKEFKDILLDEVEDIDYQIAHEQKHMENGVKWHYGAKSSKKARMEFVRQIEKMLKEADSSDDERFKFYFDVESSEMPYSYNWPYDYFSLVELAKLDASVKWDKKLVPPPTTETEEPFQQFSRQLAEVNQTPEQQEAPQETSTLSQAQVFTQSQTIRRV